MNSFKYKVKSTNRKIEPFDGRPDREEVIDFDDIMNLRIAMEIIIPKGHDPLNYFLAIT